MLNKLALVPFIYLYMVYCSALHEDDA